MQRGKKQDYNYAHILHSNNRITKAELGFTLIELMIVVSIIAVLATVAMSTYQRYMIRGQVAEGLSLSGGAKVAVSDYYMNQGTWPTDNAVAGLAEESQISGSYTAQVEVKDNVIEIQYGFDAHTAIFGELLVLTALDNSGSVSWSCASAGAIETVYLPEVCR